MNKLLFAGGLLVTLLLSNCNAGGNGNAKTDSVKTGGVIHLTNAEFKQKVYDYSQNKEWKYLGNKPAIIDFYASWCGPCRTMSPIIEDIAKEYAGKLIVYKIDTDAEQMLAQEMGITGLPTILFIPQNGKPQAAVGALPRESLIKAIHEVLLIN